MLRHILHRQLRHHRGRLSLLALLQCIQTAASLYLPDVNAAVIDDGLLAGDTLEIWRLGGVMGAVTLLQALCALSALYLGSQLATDVGRALREDLFKHVLTLSAQESSRFGVASLITRTTNDVQQVQALVVLGTTMLVPAPLMCVGGVVMALDQDVPLSSLLLISVPVLGMAAMLISQRMRGVYRGLQDRVDEVNRVLREQIAGVRTIRAFTRDADERQRFGRASADLREVSLRAGRLAALMLPVVMLIANLSSVAVVWFGGHRIDDGDLRIGALTAFLGYLGQILGSIMMATLIFMLLPRAEVSAERIQEVFAARPAARPGDVSGRGDQTPDGDRLLEIRAAGYRYPGAQEPVLRNLDLRVGAGEVTAVVGSTGSGKSTLLGLVARLYDATTGSVEVNGMDVRDLAPRSLARLIGYVPQQPYLFSGTIASNLRYGNPEASDTELWDALEVAQAKTFVTELGLDATVAQGGANLSGGQRQRLAIARALVPRPRIFLFDDTFASLDYTTAKRLRGALTEETADAAVVITTQQISTVRHADRIVLLDQGAVVGSGTHPELMRSCEAYRQLALSQSEEEAVA
ncbi:ABC transporter ATP-binding protein [Streptomyces sp. SudanB182_2057]|uniref:ABC transporter ATP-binding protein n=1 Tax=Streptomyces sp. SudanB182_2057 TaxID=3035281 RepID=UPI003F5719B2